MDGMADFRSQGNILLVERDPRLRAFVSRVLTEAGYVVFECEDGYQAFLLSESLTQPVHLLIAEVDLGTEPGGVELSRHLQVLRPGLRVLFLSTVPSNSDLRRELQAMLDSYLSKPFSAADLLDKVRAQMEKRRQNPGRKGNRMERGNGMPQRAAPARS
jgi:DNA-binding response OmpR family regulator